ncbi:Quinate permease protein [Rutstroemia sp. NJR-2017a WRK4]|nr:Quinate permease protein [Rutstroemia sp. NJR-2017a WRK4]
MSSTLALLRKHKGAVTVAAVANTASMLFGYDTGVAGSVVALRSFSKEFGLSISPKHSAYVSSNIVALLNAGAFFGAIAPAALTKYLGRKPMMTIAACFMMLGGILQTAAQPPHLSMIYAGRVISGFGVGMVSNLTPVFVAETAPKELRGLLMGFFEMMLVSGGLLAYWTTYGCSLHLQPTSKQWRVPLSIQIILAAIIFTGSFFIIESPRWLAKQNRWDEAEKALCYLRGADSDDMEIKTELAEMHAQIEEEITATSGRTIAELFQSRNLMRLLWGCGVSFFSIWCGHNGILYYGPTVFKQIGFTAQNAALFASGIFTCIKWVVTVIFLLGGIQHFKRKRLLSIGSAGMAITMFSLAAVLATHPPATGALANNTPSGKGMMAIIYIFVVFYSMSWGPLSWIYIGEIYPVRIRDWGMCISVMIVWLFNYVVSRETPIAVLNIGWKTWTIFGTFNAVAFIFTWFLPETKGLSLEEMDVLFKVVNEDTRKKDVDEHIGVPVMSSEKSEKSMTGEGVKEV